jgi:hypothetical protein
METARPEGQRPSISGDAGTATAYGGEDGAGNTDCGKRDLHTAEMIKGNSNGEKVCKFWVYRIRLDA